ncbi:zinc finger ZZ-type and EF-hand domain-containing protein 1-like [Watersipora subatra]|uniref:zinc finger ZZ-type and EF-hand domain-containing protein 1-like n=1 Tax=Watersipora subatra TaxID=2589382 RepID=UPI00355C0F42
MGISSSSSSENEEDDNATFSWKDAPTSSESSEDSEPENQITEPVENRTPQVKIDLESITDLRVLFNDSTLKELGSVSTKDETRQNALQKHQIRILSWLTDLNLPLSESIITQDMFCDFLATKGVSREDAIAMFSRFDTDGTGKADAELVQEGVTHPYEEAEDGELVYRTRVLQSCSSLPGFVDVFSKTDPSSRHASKLLNFLIRNRASASSFQLPMLAGFEDITQLRRNVGNEILLRLEKEMSGGEEVKLLCGDSVGDVKSTGKPYTSIQVSSNSSDVHKLTDGNTGSYWQSDGAARSHFIRFNMKKNVVVKQLHIYVNSSDQSYQPQELVVSVGRKSSLKEIKEHKVPASMTGPFLVVENLKVYYPIVQVNIRRCHSDGCDTRIRLVKITGLRVVKEAEMSVRDASIKWFFQLITSTALHSAQSLPSYRQLIIQQAKDAFRYIPPMSLSHGSSDKPKFLTQPILLEIEQFLEQVTRSELNSADADEGILCKVMYGLASCDLSMLISAISHLLDNPEKTIDTGTLLSSMQTVQDKYWRKGERQLPFTYIDCDGGEKQSESASCIHPKDLILHDQTDSSETAYTTKKGRTKFTLILEASDSVQITRIKVRPDKGGKGVKCGIVFLLPASEVISLKRPIEEKTGTIPTSKSKQLLTVDEQKALYKRLEKYDGWTAADYEEHKSSGVNTDHILTYFNTPEDPNEWDEYDVTISWKNKLVGRIIVIKFLQPRSAESENIGLIGVNFFGYADMSDCSAEVCQPGQMTSAEFADSILSFLIAITRSLENRPNMVSKMAPVDFSRLTVSLVTGLFERALRLAEPMTIRRVLRLCHCIFLNWAPGKNESDSSLLFDTFSSFINSPNNFDHSVVAIARAVIVDGAKAFFPNDQMRREQLLRMLNDINRADELASTSLVFESLCQFFSNVEPSALLNLPHPNTCLKSADTLDAIDTSSFDVLDTLISVTLQKTLSLSIQSDSSAKSSSRLSTISSGVAHSVLVKLLSCLQTSFLAWINAMRKSGNDQLIAKSKSLLVSYLTKSIARFVHFTDQIIELSDSQLAAVFSGQEELVYSTLQQLVVFLSGYCKAANFLAHGVEILKAIWPFVARMKILRSRLPTFFLSLDSNHWNKVQAGMEVLSTWTEESPHNYPNNQNITKVFYCPGAKIFILEFDPRCHTERKYDYLEFTNFSGVVHKYDQKTGTEAWPLKVEMKGSKLQFTFHSDQSNNEWGYKFTVKAKGVPDASISPLFDLHLSLSLLTGQVCGQTISMQVSESLPCNAEEENKQTMLKSNLWKTLFRAGYQPSGELERSLSGRFTHGCFDNVKGYLLELLNDPSSEPYSSLLTHLQSRCRHYQKIGTDEISSAVLHTFSVLVYHTSDICESLNDYINAELDISLLIEGVYQAYNIAEHLRLPLIKLRQKTLEKGQAEDFTLAKEMVDKANLLLRFAPLTKAPTLEKCVKSIKPRKTSARLTSSHDLLKRLEGNIPERYGQFRLVLEFILDVVLFLRAVLNMPESFPSHYADAIDGCGLEQESKLRKHFYALIRLLVRYVNSFHGTKHSRNVDAAWLVVQSCLLHLLAVDWRENDLMFLKEIGLPKLLFEASKNNVAVRERITHATDEREELVTYERDRTYYSECYDSFNKWYSRNSATHSKNKDVQMFIARHCDLLDVEIYCDGCKQTMPGRRYRCLECIDMDLCVTCFTGGVNPGGDHNGDHSFVYFMYKCDICKAFISGERVHCKVCDDFDLCYGCYKTEKSQPGHDPDHAVVKYSQTRLKSSCDSNKLASYIHQHAWLQFSQLTLAMAGTVFEQNSRSDEEYADTAGHLLTQCLSLITDCLQVSALPTKVLSFLDQATSYREEVFVQHSQERIMGLLGAIIALDEQHDAELNTMLTTIDFLKFIFYIASGHGGYGNQSTVQHLALGLLCQLMQKSTISTQVTDEAVLRTQKRPFEELEDQESGIATIDFLVHAASSCLQRQQGIDWSYSLIRLLQQLIHTEHWAKIMKKYLVQSVTSLMETMTLDLVLCLLVITDFPQVKSPGVTVTYLDYASDEKKGVILKHFPDRMQSMLIDTVTRKRKMVRDQVIDKYSPCPPFYDDEIASLITRLILDKASNLTAGTWMSTHSLWVLSLCLKAFDQFVTRLVPYENLEVIRSLVNLAGMGTGLSKLWLVSDLEILSLMLYIKLQHDASKTGSKTTKSLDKSTAAGSGDTARKSPFADSPQLFPDMDSDSRKNLFALLDMLNVPRTQLAQLYQDHNGSPSLIFNTLQRLFVDDSSDKSKRSASKQPSGGRESEQGEMMIDFGILPSTSIHRPPVESLETLKAAEEKVDAKNSKKSPSPSNSSVSQVQRSTSAKLLKAELGSLLKESPSQAYLKKVNTGLSILYARQALATILANWSVSGPRISAELLNCEQHNLALVLDVLNRDATNLKQFEKVVSKVMSCCKEDYLQSVTDSASYFMEEKKTDSAVRESPHQKGKHVKGKVNIKGASVIAITFDKCCHTSTESRLELSTSSDMKKNHHKFNGPKENWKDFEVPGDMLYFEYHAAASGPSKWRFTVKKAANSSSGSFFTGFVILNHILSTPSYCRIIDAATLWKRLVVVACEQTGDQRLKVIQLLLYLLQSHLRSDDDSSFEGPSELTMDLKYLAPLWKLYKSLSDEHGPEQTSAVLRALTELFFIAEDVAMQWNVTGEFMSCMIDPSVLQSSILDGVKRVIAVSAALGHDTGFAAIQA